MVSRETSKSGQSRHDGGGGGGVVRGGRGSSQQAICGARGATTRGRDGAERAGELLTAMDARGGSGRWSCPAMMRSSRSSRSSSRRHHSRIGTWRACAGGEREQEQGKATHIGGGVSRLAILDLGRFCVLQQWREENGRSAGRQVRKPLEWRPASRGDMEGKACWRRCLATTQQ